MREWKVILHKIEYKETWSEEAYTVTENKTVNFRFESRLEAITYICSLDYTKVSPYSENAYLEWDENGTIDVKIDTDFAMYFFKITEW